MSKRTFKIRDKVKLKNPSLWGFNDYNFKETVGVITGFDNYIRVSWDNRVLEKNYPHLAKEIELISIKGQQLVFPFMLQQ